ncbi:MAG: Crp/Fnr family transcriptional regulator [Pyrinomonadaceae bacterium]|nr:Crp/Fnr family transcriptional regulator [Pyrinomonadaceae bacterium]MBP6214449.1 Crp/Fnr family transcriptional regulator [Pyrinomonadaceae bacterium]
MTPLLDSINQDLITELRKFGRTHKFNENEEIFAGGDNADFLPVVLSGKVKMINFLEPGKEVIIGIFGKGEMFAIPPVFDGGRYPATAIAMERTDLLMIARSDFLDLIRRSSELAFAVIEWTCAMLREKTATIQNLATASPDHRIGNVLIKLASGNTDDSPVKITLRREDIAKMAGLTTETTIRVIRRLAELRMVRIDHGKIFIDDISKLKRHVES